MKKIIFILFAFTIPSITNACDICGCGVGNSYMGILPDFRKHIFGLRYRYNSMLTHIGAGGVTTYLTSNERFTNLEAWGGWNITSKFRIMASIPYSFDEKQNQGNKYEKNGIGDISLSAFYRLLNDSRTILKNKLLVQSLWIGGGVKFATGSYDPSAKSSSNNNANLFQLGTGSNDFSLATMYDIRLQDLGLNISSNYKITTANKYQYEYGNKFTLNTQVYYKIKVSKQVRIAPNAGIQYEKAGVDRDKGFNVQVSGGRLLLGTLGAETTVGKYWAVGANFQTPLSQSLAHGIIKAQNRLMVHLAIAL